MTEEEQIVRERGTKKIKCSCYSLFQDEKYGQGKRLANKMKDPGKSRCTVCGKVDG
jgi:hypothetical protein